MTAPVPQSGDARRWRIAFVMPARYDRATLPLPQDPRIAIRKEPAVAVLRFSGSTSPAGVDRGAWFYDPPSTIPAARRNELWRPVARRES